MEISSRIDTLVHKFSGRLGIAAINLTTGAEYEQNAHDSFYPASTCKLPILFELFKGVLEGRWLLHEQRTLRERDKTEGSGVLLNLTPGLHLTIYDLAVLMITISDNTATNMLLDLFTPADLNRSIAELGITGVRLNRKIGTELAIPLGEATPAGMARLMHLIATGQVLTPEACKQMIAILERQQYKELTSRYIPETDTETGNSPVRVASKSGWIRGIRNEVALITTPRATYVLSIFSRDCLDRRYYPDNEGNVTLARISQAFYEVWGG